MYFAFTLYDGLRGTKKEDLQRAPYMDRNIDLTQRRLLLAVKDFHRYRPDHSQGDAHSRWHGRAKD